ncbi:hypothetical protein GOODEAATRI_009612 [Goodea atripinnis]|uniref:Uncharacterized protein n=1 Tax=Goodea atripinnis TaxID=208336 RepID=A0ABV0PCT7_9TELE
MSSMRPTLFRSRDESLRRWWKFLLPLSETPQQKPKHRVGPGLGGRSSAARHILQTSSWISGKNAGGDSVGCFSKQEEKCVPFVT